MSFFFPANFNQIIPEKNYAKFFDEKWMGELINSMYLRSSRLCEMLDKFEKEKHFFEHENSFSGVEEDVLKNYVHEDIDEFSSLGSDEKDDMLQKFRNISFPQVFKQLIWASMFGSILGPLHNVSYDLVINNEESKANIEEHRNSLVSIISKLRKIRDEVDLNFFVAHAFATSFCLMYGKMYSELPVVRRKIIAEFISDYISKRFKGDLTASDSEEEYADLMSKIDDDEFFGNNCASHERHIKFLKECAKSNADSPEFKLILKINSEMFSMLSSVMSFLVVEFRAMVFDDEEKQTSSFRVSLVNLIREYLRLCEVCFFECGIKPPILLTYPYRMVFKTLAPNSV